MGAVPTITAQGLTKRFGGRTAVDDLDLRLVPGQILGFLGPNGAGKTTTIRMLMGFLRPTGGSATLLGAPAGDLGVRERIGYLPGDLRVDPAMTGAQLLGWYAGLRGGRDPRRERELIERLGLDPSRPFGSLSKGNRQKVGIVQAFCHDPQVLILDEPTTGLDPLVQREFLELLTESAGRGATVLFSSHVLPEVERVASEIAIIRDGHLLTVSTVEQLLDRARRRLEFRFAHPVPDDTFTGVPGVVDTRADGRTVVVSVDGPVGPALRRATDSGLVLRVGPAGDDLEDLFVSLYEGTGGGIPAGSVPDLSIEVN